MKTMKLQEKYNVEIPEGYCVEYPAGSGIYHIPIIRVKEMLWLDFERWDQDHFEYQYLQRGHTCILSGHIKITVHDVDCGVHTLIGGANFNVNEKSENAHYIATLKSECIKNAAKDIGKKYGFYLNQGALDIQTLIENGLIENPKTVKKDKSTVASSLSDTAKKHS